MARPGARRWDPASPASFIGRFLCTCIAMLGRPQRPVSTRLVTLLAYADLCSRPLQSLQTLGLHSIGAIAVQSAVGNSGRKKVLHDCRTGTSVYRSAFLSTLGLRLFPNLINSAYCRRLCEHCQTRRGASRVFCYRLGKKHCFPFSNSGDRFVRDVRHGRLL